MLLPLILFIVTYTIFSLGMKISATKQEDDTAFTVATEFIAGVGCLAFTPLFAVVWSTDWRVWVLFAISGVFLYTAVDRLHTTARKHLDITTDNIIGELQTGLMVIVGLTIFREQFRWSNILGAIIIVTSNLFLLLEKPKITGKRKQTKYILLRLLSVICFTTAITIDIDINQNFNPPLYYAMSFFLSAVSLTAIFRISPKRVSKIFTRQNWIMTTIAGLSWGATCVFSIMTYNNADASVVTPLMASTLIINSLFAYIFLQERKNIVKKIISAVGVIIGILLISL
jgi:drug/metabolite transporter (DMT)-like permease